MKRSIMVLLSGLILLSFSSTVFAVLPECANDCEGWMFGGSLQFGTADYMPYEFTVELYQGTELKFSYFEEGEIHRDDANFTFSGSWGMDLCGEYTAVSEFTIYGPWGTYTDGCTETFPCECGPPPTCTYTPGYWKNHLEAWPDFELLTVGCVDYTKAQLDDIFDWSTEGDMTIKLFHHLVAAKFNVMTGSDDYIMSAITAGDDFLCVHPLGSAPVGDAKDDAEAIKDDLANYNEIECEEEEEEDKDDMITIDQAPSLEKASAPTEERSWGSIKKKNQ